MVNIAKFPHKTLAIKYILYISLVARICAISKLLITHNKIVFNQVVGICIIKFKIMNSNLNLYIFLKFKKKSR